MSILKLAFVFILVGIGLQISAQKTTVYFQNNTPLILSVSGVQFGTHVMDTNEWHVDSSTSIDPWQSEKEIFWTNRDNGVHNNELFYFDVFITKGTDTITLQFFVEGEFINSDMDYSARGNTFNHPWYNNGGFHEESFMFDGIPVTLKYKPLNNDLTSSRDLLFALQDNRKRYELYSSDFLNPNVLNVLSYNVKFLPPPIGSSSNDDVADVIPNYIDTNQDIVVYQEAFQTSVIDNNLTPAMTAKGFTHHTQILNENSDPLQQNGGVIIYSKWPIDTTDEYDFRSCDNNKSDCLSDKGILYAKINKLGVPYHIFGTHLEAGKLAGDIAVIKEQFGEMRDFIAKQNIPYNQAVIMAGDMNINANHSHFPSVLDSLNPIIGPHKGWHSSKSIFDDTLTIIDHVWGDRKHLAPLNCYTEALLIRGIDDELWEKFDPSDHMPVNGRFEYPNVPKSINDSFNLCHPVASLTLLANTIPNATYQWYVDSNIIQGATDSIYLINNTSVSDTGMYTCEVSYSFIVNDTSNLSHPNWPDTADQLLIDSIANINYFFNFAPKIVVYNDTLFSNINFGVQWHNLNGPITGATNSFYVVTSYTPHTYYLTVTNGFCSATSDSLVHYSTTNIKELNNENKISLFPNPAKNQLTIQSTLPLTEITIYNTEGKQLKNIVTNLSTNTINLTDFKPGLYLLKGVTQNKDSINKRFVKK